ncbi:MAG: selenoneine biosynthesis selenosugar synthase SenB [Phycisphaerales bacterium JB063]
MPIRFALPRLTASRNGMTATRDRWAGLLRDTGHDVAPADDAAPVQPGDTAVVLNGYKSRDTIHALRAAHGDRITLVVCMTGTDLYRDLPANPDHYATLDLADALILLHPGAERALPERFHGKATVIVQSATVEQHDIAQDPDHFDLCVLGHLRDVKDPMRAAEASRLLPASSRVRVVHAGKALTPEYDTRAKREAIENPRYRWLGEQDRAGVEQTLLRSRGMVLSSLLEGGANVIGESIVAGRPVLSSRTACAVGLLGEDYPGLFDIGDTRALATLMRRLETDDALRNDLTQRCESRRALFDPAAERAALRSFFDALPTAV